MTTLQQFNYTIRLADDALILGQRLSEWCGHGPVLEEDIALANIALDYVGQATNLYKHASQLDAAKRDEDTLALTRMESEYNNLLMLELPNGDYAFTIARQYYYTSFYLLFLDKLKSSNDTFLSGFAEKSIKELRYHVQHASDWIRRMGDGTAESHRRIQEAVNQLWPYVGEMFLMDSLETELAKTEYAVDRSVMVDEWKRQCSALFEEATLLLPTEAWHHKGGRDGRHTEHMGYLLAEMQYLQRAYPGAKW
ncbi:MAG: 1,2-phenylacetyl-CoA epoxidase subunit PaaC [Flavobacteriales bacterium]|jgi:ring-1,2-phenylacetyl-CoA epoxidase subunit PaaC